MKMTLDEAMAAAQRLANTAKAEYGIWQHVGQYGHASGDIAANYNYKFGLLSQPDPSQVWALVATVAPEPLDPQAAAAEIAKW